MNTPTFKQWLREDGDITTGLKSLAGTLVGGFKDGKRDVENTVNKIVDADKKAKSQQAERDKKEINDKLKDYLNNLFTQFPYYDNMEGPEEILQKYQSFESAEQLFKFFKNVSEKIEKMRVSMNQAMVSQKKLTRQQSNEIDRRSKQAILKDLPPSIISFVKKESDFFERLFIIDPTEFDLDDMTFKQLLSAKIRATEDARIPDAVMALNIIFRYIHGEFFAQAKTIAPVAKARKLELVKNS